MKILVCGSHTFDDYASVEHYLWVIAKLGGTSSGVEIISGGANGADKLAEKFVDNMGCIGHMVPADWEKHGKSAGIIRNNEMLDMGPDIVVAFWDGKSRGTQHTLTEAMKRKIPTLTVYF